MTAAPTLILRADGVPGIGGGHVMRCIALAQAWREMGGRAVFCSAQLAPALRQRLTDEGFDGIVEGAAAGSSVDAEATIAAAARLGARVVVVDGYHFPVEFHERLRASGLKTAAIDDNGDDGTYVDDLVINQNRHAVPALYPRRGGHTRLLLGTEFALLRREFRSWQGVARTFPDGVRRVLVTLGAADPSNATTAVMTALGPVVPAGAEIAVVVGGINAHGQAIAASAARLPHCRLLRDPGSALPHLMATADLAVCAGGGTMWEMAFMGVPFIAIIIADNQRLAAAAMASDGFSAIDRADIARALPAAVAALVGDAARRAALSRRGRELVDGRGAERVCALLQELTR